jgi:hypothetical protein
VGWAALATVAEAVVGLAALAVSVALATVVWLNATPGIARARSRTVNNAADRTLLLRPLPHFAVFFTSFSPPLDSGTDVPEEAEQPGKLPL